MRRPRAAKAPKKSDKDAPDLTVVAIPFYFGSMAVEYLWLRRRAARRGRTPGDYERRDTVASLTMGVASLLAPLVGPKLLRPFTPGRGRYGRAVVVGAAGAVVLTTAADAVVRRATPRTPGPDARLRPDGPSVLASAPVPEPALATGNGIRTSSDNGSSTGSRNGARIGNGTLNSTVPGAEPVVVRVARRVAAVGGVTAVVAGGVAITTTWTTLTTSHRLWKHRILPDVGRGPVALAAAIAGWDFLYYWDHRFMHSSRYMWAIHVVHHSSEHYNLSTALRQPVAEAFGTFVPFGSLCLLGVRPGLVETARGANLLYQYWIHTETVGRLGPGESVLNTPSHHRVHHGSNKQYLDRNHGSILIVWDRLFGTFEPEQERVVYGLTKNINTFDPRRIATHEYIEILRDVAASTSWRERLSYIVRGPGWATTHRAERAAAAEADRVISVARPAAVAVGA